MPYSEEYYSPKGFMVHREVEVYHCYKDNYLDSQMPYRYSLDPEQSGCVEDILSFDVRDLPRYQELAGKGSIADHQTYEAFKKVIAAAIDSGDLDEYNPEGGNLKVAANG